MTDFFGANLAGADLSLSNLSAANLAHADLHDANLEEANLLVADLNDANLSGANLHNTRNLTREQKLVSRRQHARIRWRTGFGGW